MSIRSGLGAARRRVLCSFYRRAAFLKNRGPIVSFSFDDFPRTAYLTGGAILERFGGRGTFYAAIALMNTCGELGEYFRAEDLHSLLRKGHELASHTYSHISCRSVSSGIFLEDVRKGKKAIEEETGMQSSNFAYPFGHVTLQTKRIVGFELASARGIVPGFNGPEIDLNLLRANRLYGDVDAAEAVEDLIAENTRRKSWLVFYTHDVQPSPSNFGCTPALLEAAVSSAARSASRILTVQDTLAELGVQKGHPEVQACL